VTASRFDGDALRKGITVAAAITLPAAVISWFTDHSATDRGPAGLLTVVVIFGLFLGGFGAARFQLRNAPLSHSLITVLSVVGVLQILRIARLAIVGKPLALPAALGNVLLGLVTAVLAGLLAGQKTGKAARDN
jgi:hypothetical protein